MTRWKLTFAMLGLILLGHSVEGHPLPKLRYDRTIRVQLGESKVRIHYDLEMSELTLALDGEPIISAADLGDNRSTMRYAEVYIQKKAPFLADNLNAKLNDTRLNFSFVSGQAKRDRDHLRIEFEFEAPWQPSTMEQNQFRFQDDNFVDRLGAVFLTIGHNRNIDLIEAVEPTDLRGKSPLEYGPGDAERALRASAVFSLNRPEASARDHENQPEALARDNENETVADVSISSEVEESPGIFTMFRERGIAALFDTNLGLGLMLLLSALFGAAHAFTPGHGKTMVAAYLVGEKGTYRHAIVLGIVATLTHTGSVIALAIIMYNYYGNTPPEEAQGWLTVAGGLLITFVGLWLLLQRVRGKADHVHLFTGNDHHHHGSDGHHHHHDGHSHDHHHHHEVPANAGSFGWVRVILLGLGGGIIPCWDAVLLFLVAMARGKVGLAIPLLIAFSLGLAAVLIGLGVAVVKANQMGSKRFKEARWFRYLPVVSATILFILGIWFVRDGIALLQASQQ